MRSSSRTPRTSENRRPCRQAIAVLGLALAAPGMLLAQAKEEPKTRIQPPATRLKLVKVWASDTPEAPEKPKAGSDKEGKDALQEYRKLLEKHTGKRCFTIDTILQKDAVPDKAIILALSEDTRMEITPQVEGQQTILQISLWRKDIEKSKDVEKRKFEVRGSLPLIYCTPLRSGSKELVVIVQKIEQGEKKKKG